MKFRMGNRDASPLDQWPDPDVYIHYPDRQLLSFADAPDQIMPSSPAQNLKDLHDLTNRLFRKQAQQALRQKTNPVFRPGAEDDATRNERAVDGQWIKNRDPAGISVIHQGGIDPANVPFGALVDQTFDRMAGNLQASGGLGPQAGTFGQEELIHQAVSRMEAKRLSRTHDFTSRAVGAIGHLMWVDQVLEIPDSFEVAPGSGIYADASWKPDVRSGDYWLYNFDVQPYSMAYQSAEARLAKLQQAVGTVLNLMPAIQQSGGAIDAQEILNDYAEFADLPEMKKWLTFSGPPASQQSAGQGGGGDRDPMPGMGKPNGQYTRTNVSQGQNPQDQMTDLLSAKSAQGVKARGIGVMG
jgi:hypothetical protein